MSDEINKEDDISEVEAVRTVTSNDYFKEMMDRNFLEYASYVIKDRAIPDVDDGFKPVQRRILWSLHRIDDGRTHKAANVIGHTMQFHPHGDASIGDALVVLANKEYFVEKQGNFGNIFTGSPAAAPRYIECCLSPLAREVLFNNAITELVDSYDGRNQEPVVLPVKIPSLLMLGAEGIAVGMSTKIVPHNFNELLEAQIAELNGESFQLFPDFLQGGLMDAREYEDGNGKITLRAKIVVDGKRILIKEIPASTTTESLIASIEKAAEKNKLKIASIRDYTSKEVEIEVIPTRGYDCDKAIRALYAYTDCSVSISVNLMVIRDHRPVQMSVTEVIKRNTQRLLEYLKRELELEMARLEDQFHAKTLAQIFFENRIYKRIEECKSQEEEYKEVHSGLAPFRHLLRRDITNEDVDKLLALPVRRISRFDIEKNQRELAELLENMKQVNHHLKHLKDYAVDYLKNLLNKYGKFFPRRTEIEYFDKIDRRAAALNNIKVGYDRKTGYVGTAVKSDDLIACNEFDRFLCVEKNGTYKVIPMVPEKMFAGKLYDFRKYDPATEFGIVYRDTKTGKYYGKRSSISGFILEKEYQLCPDNCKIELLTPRSDAIYLLTLDKGKTEELNLMTLPARSAKARGILISSRPVTKITHQRYLEADELAALRQAAAPEADDSPAEDIVETAEVEITETITETVEITESAVTDTVEITATIEVAEAVEKPAKNVRKPDKSAPAEPPAAMPAATADNAADETSDNDPLLDVPPTQTIDKPAKTKPKRKGPPINELPPDKDGGEDDDFGIVQPEFGF